MAILGNMPRQIQPYLALARIDKPIGTWLLLLPCFWGIALAQWETGLWLPSEEFHFYVLFALGAFLMRSAGCAYNDIVDRDLDKSVARTKFRPVASGALSVRQAALFMALLCALAFLILLQFNLFAVMVGCASLGLVALYPFMKRITYWPQFFLGLAFNWGVLLSYAALTGMLTGTAGLLYLAGIFWTLYYDTIYALQDKEDDLKIGIKSSALAVGARVKPFLALMAALMILCLLLLGALSYFPPVYYIGIAGAGFGLIYQLWTLKTASPADALQKFRENRLLGAVIFLSLLAGRL